MNPVFLLAKDKNCLSDLRIISKIIIKNSNYSMKREEKYENKDHKFFKKALQIHVIGPVIKNCRKCETYLEKRKIKIYFKQ